jgi:hypothetical protein
MTTSALNTELTVETTFVSYGICITVSLTNRELLPPLMQSFPVGWKPSTRRLPDRKYSLKVSEPRNGSGARKYVLSYNARRLAQSERLADALAAFKSHSRLFIAEMTTQRVFLHAGVVGWRGKAILLPGRSWSGKTTLVAEMVRAGATYFSDEYAVIDRRCRVHPYLKPLSLRDRTTGHQTDHSVTSLGGTEATMSLPVGLVLVSKYCEGSVWRPKRLSAGEGIMELMDNSISIRRSPKIVLPALGKLASQAEVIKGVRGAAGQVVDYLLKNYSAWA